MSHHETRTKVSEAYAKAIAGTGGCCATKKTGEVPSFGCGDPIAFAGVSPGETVLDLGSGAGHDLIAAAEAVGETGRVIGVDMTDAMLEAARDHTRDYKTVELRKGIIEELPVEDASVDWVISNCVINLSPEKDRVFAEIARVLAPGGRFSISDIVAEELPEHIRNSEAAYSACVAGAVSQEEYVAGLAAAGLTDIEIQHRHDYTADEICGLSPMERGDAERVKAASIRVVGRKPA